MERHDRLRRIAENADRLSEDLWTVRTGRITDTQERIAWLAERLQKYGDRFSREIIELIEDECIVARRAENERQLSFFGTGPAFEADTRAPDPEPTGTSFGTLSRRPGARPRSLVTHGITALAAFGLAWVVLPGTPAEALPERASVADLTGAPGPAQQEWMAMREGPRPQ